MLQLILSVLAIILAIVALIPYVLEIWRWRRKMPKLVAKVANMNTHGVDVRFWLVVSLSRGYPAYFRDLRLILPLKIEPYPHPDTTETFRQEAYIEGPELRRALVLNVPYRSLSPQYSHVYMIALRTPDKQHSINLELVAEIETDEARLGFWSIFHHARRYLHTLPMELQLDQPKSQEFVG